MTHRRPRLTVRARLTLLYTTLFTVCGAVVVGVSYAQVAQLKPRAQAGDPRQPAFATVPAGLTQQCQAQQRSASPSQAVLAKCAAYFEQRAAFFQQQGAAGQRDLTLSHLLQYSLIALAVVIVLAAILGWLAAGRALRPVHLITAAARAASEHDLSARVAPRGPRGPRDELRELAETFDEMLGRLQAAFHAQQRFIANASHELRTPLAVMGATVDVVLGDPGSTAQDLREMAADIRGAVNHAEHLIEALLLLARNQRGLSVREEVDLATVAEDVLDAATPGEHRVHAQLDPAPVVGDPVLAEHLISNLVDNATRYNTATGGDLWVATRVTPAGSELTVANTGTVISPDEVARIFEPFQRLSNRSSHKGSGLGLAIVASIAAVHQGTVTAHPRDGGGLCVKVTIPAGSSQP